MGGSGAGRRRLRERIGEISIETDKGPFGVTVSVGCASFMSTPEANVETLVQLADRRLYAAKHSGRNRVVATGV